MTKYLGLRWIFLLAALAGAARWAYSGAAPGRVLLTAACGLAWFRLSQLKVRSLDRATLGVPARRGRPS